MKKEKTGHNSEFKSALLSRVKGLIVPVILSALIIVAIVFVVTYKNAEEQEEVIKMYGFEGDTTPLVMENEYLKFTLDPTTTHFTVEVKETDKVWYSNPTDVANDAIAQELEKTKLESTLGVTYSEVKGSSNNLNNWKHSVQKGNYSVEQGPDYIRVNYTIGDTEREYIIPPACKQEEFDEWLEKMDPTAKNLAKQIYRLYDLNNLRKKDNKEELLEMYPSLAEGPLYVLYPDASKTMKAKVEANMEELGYTTEMYAVHKELVADGEGSDKPIYNVSIIYTLDGQDMIVKVPLADIEYKKDYPMTYLDVLPNFGAGGKDDKGYMLVPEGGGAIINYNNGKTSQNAYYANLYGWDMAVPRDAVVNNTRASFNAFAVSQDEKNSFLCVIEEGAAYAAVQADISGRFNSYNTIGTKYTIATSQEYKVGDLASGKVFVFQKTIPNETIVQRYSFLNSGNYSKLAEKYRENLLKRFDGYMTMNSDTSAPVEIEVLGAVDKKKQILGVPVRKPLKLTKFNEAGDILTQLSGEGFNNMSVKVIGWCNGGVNQKVLNKIKPLSDLGGKKALKNLISTTNGLGADIYLDGITQYAYDSDILDGFNSYSDAAKFISKERAELFVYSDVTFSQREGLDSYWLLHNGEALKMSENLINATQGYGTGVSFRDTGMDLSSDFWKKNYVSRQAAMLSQIEQVKAAKDAGQKICFNMGNDYMIGYADLVTNMNLRGSKYAIIDKNVPFYQMAIHGYVNYTGKCVNNAGDVDEEVLTSAEYGAGLSFSVMNESAFALQKTLYTEYYGSSYSAWHDRMVSIYTRYNNDLGHTFNQKIVNHEYITSELTCTTYEDGTKVYVNYGYTATTVRSGEVIPARDYLVVRF